MSQENVEIVRQALAATSGGDPYGWRPLADPSVEWDMSGVPQWAEKSLYRGEEVWEFLHSWADSWQDWHFEVTDLRDAGGDCVFSGIHEWGIGGESEASVEQYRYLIFTLRSSSITRVEMFSDRSEALEAAGLRE
jgi:ketosteroid isomerase-like protein